MEDQQNYAQTIVEVATRAAAIPPGALAQLEMLHLAPLHRGLKLIDLAGRLPAPLGTHAHVTLLDPADFADYVNRYKTRASVIFADTDAMRFRAVLDYHEAGGPRWARHQAVYPCPLTKEFEAWRAIEGKEIAQADFAEFIEEHVPEIVQPDGAALQEAVQYLIAHKTVSYKSAKDLHSGDVQLVYEEETTTGGRQGGEVKLPRRFTLGIRVFRGGVAQQFDALLRFRIDPNRKLWFKFKIHRFDEVREVAFNGVAEEIDERVNPPIDGDASDGFEVPIFAARDEPAQLCMSYGAQAPKQA
jgi:uncharacterized protein YfdQ (DUF2303 family)